jgi:hypothetical protein
MKTIPFTARLWEEMGQAIGRGICTFKSFITGQEVLERERSVNRYQKKDRASTSMGNRHAKRYSTE